jgi:hypothetical protein
MKVKSVVVGSMAKSRYRLDALGRRIVERRSDGLSYKSMLSLDRTPVSARPSCLAGEHLLDTRSKGVIEG